MAARLRCMLTGHDWQQFKTPHGGGQKCSRCGEVTWLDREPESHGPQDRDWKGHVHPG